MKRSLQNIVIAFASLLALLACGLLTPSDKQGPQQTAPAPTTQPMEIPSGRLLVGSGADKRSVQYHVLQLPEQTVEAYPALDSDASQYAQMVSISPDFSHFAFERVVGNDSPRATLYVMDIYTGVPTKVASSGDDYVSGNYINWSLDGQWLSYNGGTFPDMGQFAYNLPTGNLSEMQVEIFSSFPGPALSPNGDRLVYDCRDCDEGGLYMIDTHGSNPRFLLKGAYTFYVWHPDGTRLYLAEQLVSGMAPHVYRFDLATGTKTEIPGAEYLFYPLMLSPNGKLLAYNDSKRGLTFINTEDDSILPVSISFSLGGYWSPDSRYICNFSDKGRYAYILDVQTGGRAQIDLGVPDSEVYGWLP